MTLSYPRSDLNLVEVKHLHRGTSFFNIIVNKCCILLQRDTYSRVGPYFNLGLMCDAYSGAVLTRVNTVCDVLSLHHFDENVFTPIGIWLSLKEPNRPIV